MLLLIDLQSGFTAATRPKVVETAKKEIKKAIDRKKHIVVVEYKGFGETLPELWNMCKDYELCHNVTKCHVDGGWDILKELRSKGITPSKVKVCGIETDVCVFHTLETLTKLYTDTKFRVVKNGCDCLRVNDFKILSKLGRKVRVLG